ncbi:MAG: carboxypeptidase M32 [Myxococcota bacterium]|nr:carboxypeptidase M32 [Myxococcota bacterium]
MTPQDAYDWLLQNSREISTFASMGSAMAWDQRTYLPPQGHAHRAEQLALLTRLIHERSTDPLIGERLADVEGTEMTADPTSAAAVNIRDWRRAYDRDTKVPKRIAEELARATSRCETVWERTRPTSDWHAFAPELAKVFQLLDEKAQAIGGGDEAYDALLDEYEPGQTAASIEPIFSKLRAFLVQLVDAIKGSAVRPKTEILSQRCLIDAQKGFVRELAQAIGYDLDAGRIDTTAHPFTIGMGPRDVRITTRYAEDRVASAVFGTLHEAGHGIYEQGLPTEHWGTPRGSVPSYGIHESQSRLWENLVGRSFGFWRYFFPKFQAAFSAFDDVSLSTFVGAVNAVRPSLNRVQADEVTYNLHILVRFELELAIMRGNLTVADLPDAWRETMKTYLGVEPLDMVNGVMQDVHWSAGLVGYFPTYTLGNLYAAALFSQAKQAVGDLEGQFEKGEFQPLLEWLRHHIHGLGGTYRPVDLMRHATGSDPDPGHFMHYCETKYGELYRL